MKILRALLSVLILVASFLLAVYVRTNHVQVRIATNLGLSSITYREGNMDTLVAVEDFYPCHGFEEPILLEGKGKQIFFLPGKDGALEARIYSTKRGKLLGVEKVLWHSGEEYYCNNVNPGEIEGYYHPDTMFVHSSFRITAGGIDIAEFEAEPPFVRWQPYEVTNLKDDSILRDGALVVLPLEGKIILYSDGRVIGMGKMNP